MTNHQLDADTAAYLEGAAAATLALEYLTPEQARANYDSAPKPPPDPVEMIVDDVVPSPAGDIAVRRYYPTATDKPLPVVVFMHGGGWVLSSVAGHDALARRIAIRSGALVVSVEYRLAPEYPFPAAHLDCYDVTAWLCAHADRWGGDKDRIAIGGDSAGGNLAAGVALRARDHGLELSSQVLIYPCIDSEQDPYPSMDHNGSGYGLTTASMGWFWDHYLPQRHRSNPYAVPARAVDLSGLPPTLVQTADFDPLRDEGEVYANRLQRAGIEVQMTRYPGVVHGFVSRPHAMARAEQAHTEIAQFLKRHWITQIERQRPYGCKR